MHLFGFRQLVLQGHDSALQATYDLENQLDDSPSKTSLAPWISSWSPGELIELGASQWTSLMSVAIIFHPSAIQTVRYPNGSTDLTSKPHLGIAPRSALLYSNRAALAPPGIIWIPKNHQIIAPSQNSMRFHLILFRLSWDSSGIPLEF